MADTPILRPLNDLSVAIGPFETVSTLTVKTPVTSGVTGFLAVAETDAVAADPTLTGTVTYIGGQPRPSPLSGSWPAGWFLYQQDAAVLTDALCELKFAARGEAFIVALSTNNIRIVVRLEYQRSRMAVML